jgi:hypothetical protein
LLSREDVSCSALQGVRTKDSGSKTFANPTEAKSRSSDPSPLGLLLPFRVLRTRVVSFWLIHIRHAVRRLPGFPFALCDPFGGRKNRSSPGFTSPSGVLLTFTPPMEAYHLASSRNHSPATLMSFLGSSAHAVAEISIKMAGLPTPAEAHS